MYYVRQFGTQDPGEKRRSIDGGGITEERWAISKLLSRDSQTLPMHRERHYCLKGKPFNVNIIQVYALTTGSSEQEI